MAQMRHQGVSLDQVLRYIEQAVTHDRRLLVQLFQQLQRLAHQDGIPPAERKLGEVLGLILMGEREPDLVGLDPEAAQEIKELLDRLRKSD